MCKAHSLQAHGKYLGNISLHTCAGTCHTRKASWVLEPLQTLDFFLSFFFSIFFGEWGLEKLPGPSSSGPQVGGSLAGNVAFAGGDPAAVQAARSTDVAAVVVPILFLILLSLGVGFAILYTKHRRLQSSFTAFANSHYSSRLGSAIFSSGDDLGK